MDAISIHATLAGGDGQLVACLVHVGLFLSTPPSRVATPVPPPCGIPDRISIHATLAGGDSNLALVQIALAYFYPRHPRGWRRVLFLAIKLFLSISIHATLAGGDYLAMIAPPYISLFLSTPPSRVATYRQWRAILTHLFLSTPPSRVATAELEKAQQAAAISIHATLAGGD